MVDLITQRSVVQIPPATTQSNRMQSKATNRNRVAEYKRIPIETDDLDFLDCMRFCMRSLHTGIVLD